MQFGRAQVGVEVIAEYTVAALRRTVPPAVAGVVARRSARQLGCGWALGVESVEAWTDGGGMRGWTGGARD